MYAEEIIILIREDTLIFNMHSFQSQFDKEIELMEDLNFVEDVRETIMATSILNEVNVLKVISQKNKKVENILNRYKDNYIVRSESGSIICIKENDKEYEIKVLAKSLE